MKLATIESNGTTRVAAVLNGEVVDLTGHVPSTVRDVATLLALGHEARALVERAINAGQRTPLDQVRLRSPVLHAGKVMGVGMNYRSFVAAAQRLGLTLPVERIWFYRPVACLNGPHDDVWLPRKSTDFDYEAELAIVIGRPARYLSEAQAVHAIAGYTVANDLTLRDRVLKSVVLGKSFDTHLPLGPWVVTADELGDPHDLAIRTWVNGSLRQESNTADMIAGCHELVAQISSVCTLNPGDIILTGTPDGSGIFQKPQTSLAVGDVVKVEIEGIGAIENRIVEEPAAPVVA